MPYVGLMSKSAMNLITATEAAAILGQTVRNVARLAGTGKLEPAKKLPGLRGAYLFNPDDVDALAATEKAPS